MENSRSWVMTTLVLSFFLFLSAVFNVAYPHMTLAADEVMMQVASEYRTGDDGYKEGTAKNGIIEYEIAILETLFTDINFIGFTVVKDEIVEDVTIASFNKKDKGILEPSPSFDPQGKQRISPIVCPGLGDSSSYVCFRALINFTDPPQSLLTQKTGNYFTIAVVSNTYYVSNLVHMIYPAEGPPANEEAIKAKLELVNTLFQKWRDYISGNDGSNVAAPINYQVVEGTAKVNPFLPVEAKTYEPEGSDNPFWKAAILINLKKRVISSIFYIYAASKGFVGINPVTIKDSYVLTQKGETRLAEIETTAEQLFSKVEELDSSGLVTDEIYNQRPIVKRSWDFKQDSNASTYSSWREFKAVVDEMKEAYEQKFADETGETESCISKLTGQDSNFLMFIACVIDQFASGLLDTAIEIMQKFAGIVST